MPKIKKKKKNKTEQCTKIFIYRDLKVTEYSFFAVRQAGVDFEKQNKYGEIVLVLAVTVLEIRYN